MGEFYIANEYWFAVFQLVLAMLGMGATLTLKDFNDVAREPLAVSAGTLMQLLGVPAIAFLFITFLSLPAGVAVGLVLIASVPGGSSSNIFTHFAKGNIALSISVTAVTTLACLFTTPIILDLMIADFMPDDFVMPTMQIMKEITFNLLVPLGAGMLLLKMYPRVAPTVSKWCIRGSVLGLIMIFVGASSAGRLDVERFGLDNILLVSCFILVAMIVAWVFPKVIGLSKADATAIEMEVVVRNINLGLMLKVALFPVIIGQQNELGDMVLFTLLLYGGVMLLLALMFVALRRPKREKVAG